MIRLPVFAAALVVLLSALTGGQSSRAAAGEPSLIWWLDNPAQISGAAVPDAFSTLQRGYYSMTATLHTSGLTPGHNYTVWWAAFQNPSSCAGGCGDDDINAVIATGANPAGISVQFGGSFAAPESGEVVLTTRILEDVVDGCPKVPPYATVCAPLRDAATANALVFLLDHGPIASGEPLSSTFDGGYRSLVWFGYVVARYNQGGFDCYRAQSTYHTP